MPARMHCRQISHSKGLQKASSERPSFEPVVLTKTSRPSLLLSDRGMGYESADLRGSGVGWRRYDWASVARLILAERLPDLVDAIEFDPEAGMLAAHGRARPW